MRWHWALVAVSGTVLVVGCTGPVTATAPVPTSAAAAATSGSGQRAGAGSAPAKPFPSIVNVKGRSLSDSVALVADRIQLAINRSGSAGLASMLFDLKRGVVAVYWVGPVPPLLASVKPNLPTVEVRFVPASFSLSQMKAGAERMFTNPELKQLNPSLAVVVVADDPKGRGLVVSVAYADRTKWGHAPQLPSDYVAAIRRLTAPVKVLRVDASTDGGGLV